MALLFINNVEHVLLYSQESTRVYTKEDQEVSSVPVRGVDSYKIVTKSIFCEL